MSKFSVTVSYTKRYEKSINVIARDEDEAQEKACDIVNRWQDVEDVEAIDVSEE
jgi:hypothetical protein